MIKALTYTLVWLSIPVLILVAWLGKEEIDCMRIEASILHAEVAALTMRVDGLEQRIFFSGIEVEKLADKILDTCITDAPRTLQKKARK